MYDSQPYFEALKNDTDGQPLGASFYPGSLIRTIERRTNRCVEIEHRDTDKILTRCHVQDQSPLFALLPREIRNLIWQYSTAPFEDQRHEYKENEYYYRPGHTARLKTDTNVLLTCRRSWLEANAFPMSQAEHCFWYYRAAPDARDPTWMAQLTRSNRENFGQLHIFAQMYTIEHLTGEVGHVRELFVQSAPQEGDFQPRMLHVTIRHTDWYYWEYDEPLRFKDSWLQALLDSPDLRSTHTLMLELETVDYKVDQLLKIVERLEKLQSREFETHIIDSKAVCTKFVLCGEHKVHNWTGPVNINGKKFRPYRSMDRLKYHVITLTWKLRFPQLPHAHVATLRRAPRVPQTQPQRITLDERPDHISPFETDRTHFGRPMRRRDYKKLKAGLWPARKQEWLEMLDAGLRVRLISVHQAERYESLRRESFDENMVSFYLEGWKRKWDKDGSLLRLEK